MYCTLYTVVVVLLLGVERVGGLHLLREAEAGEEGEAEVEEEVFLMVMEMKIWVVVVVPVLLDEGGAEAEAEEPRQVLRDHPSVRAQNISSFSASKVESKHKSIFQNLVLNTWE